jgi:catechol 2,3-dioxygenase-like lactoylglutathione lyase family enzyme
MTGFGFDRMYTFIYHKDMEEADRFYGGLLGLEMEPESDWVNLYRVSEGMTIGVVQDGRGFLRATDDKPVILCQVELREAEGRVFFCEDPEGYTVEIVQRPK